jgi:hypothetical protein
MAVKEVVCLRTENVFQAFARAVRTGIFPPDAKLFPLKVGVPQPQAPDGYRAVGTVLIRPQESFAVGVPVVAATSFEVGGE